MLSNANLTKGFRAKAAMVTTYLINMSPSSIVGFKTPIEKWSFYPPNLDNVGVFGCMVYAHISQGKLEPRDVKCMFSGYPKRVKGYKLWSNER